LMMLRNSLPAAEKKAEKPCIMCETKFFSSLLYLRVRATKLPFSENQKTVQSFDGTV